MNVLQDPWQVIWSDDAKRFYDAQPLDGQQELLRTVRIYFENDPWNLPPHVVCQHTDAGSRYQISLRIADVETRTLSIVCIKTTFTSSTQ